ncbi:MAG TPA: hypothetical protein VFV66_24765 [Nonomuraea sp.]|nr:hypothetical protein [Nonomuraea sp.]
MGLKCWRNRVMAGFAVTLLAATLLPGEAYAGTGIYKNNVDTLVNRMTYDFGEQTLTGGKAVTEGTAWTPWIFTLTPNLTTYAYSKGSGGTAVLRHAASARKRSGCKWTYEYGIPPNDYVRMSCWYYTP